MGFPGGSAIKSPLTNAGDTGSVLGLEKNHLEEEIATHCSILAWSVPWPEEPGGLQTMLSQGTGHD